MSVVPVRAGVRDHRAPRLGYPLLGCFPTELGSVSRDTVVRSDPPQNPNLGHPRHAAKIPRGVGAGPHLQRKLLAKRAHNTLISTRRCLKQVDTFRTNDAEQTRSDEEDGPNITQSSGIVLNWFRANGALSSGIVEGFNNKGKLTTRKSCGFRTYEAVEIALYHNLGALPEPEFNHKFR